MRNMDDDRRRTFNRSERMILIRRSGYHCSICGVELHQGWHADHIIPFSRGGQTDIENGQALCELCNLKKGSKAMGLREWQKEAIESLLNKHKQGGRDFLTVATPGAGKTLFAATIAKHFLERGLAKRIVVVCPSTRLKTQWKDELFTKSGVKVTSIWKNGDGFESSDYKGYCTTFHSVSSSYDSIEHHKHLCRSRSTFVIFDEVHHAGDQSLWGEAIQHAFEDATFRLCLSGTPFRSDNSQIPFVQYRDGKSVPDFSYDYERAIKEKVCRAVFFPHFESEVEWERDSELHKATFEDELDEQGMSDRLRTVLDPNSEWMKRVILEAHQSLLRDRSRKKKDAGGLVICRNTRHATQIADVIQSLTGQKPALAHSEEDKPDKRIETFIDNPSWMWIVAVKMVSEGVDIPRLTKCIWATNVCTELFFRQAVGRVVRAGNDNERIPAHVFIPHDPRLIEFAQNIKEERNHVIEEEQRNRDEREDFYEQNGEMNLSSFTPLSASCELKGWIDIDGGDLTPEEIKKAKDIHLSNPHMSIDDILKILRWESPVVNAVSKDDHPDHQRESLRKECSKIASTLAYRSKRGRPIGEAIKEIHRDWIVNHRGDEQDSATVADLLRKRDWLKERLKTCGRS